ncbi:MAG: hypothetical protein NTZ09_19165 [Candidatus Hydrogenedentes bacterium]|nr:hypothetical protein [Candidatus Hydrogenedentota bacterium]
MTRVCAFYSKGRRFLDVLRCLRAKYPAAELIAVTPPNYKMSPDEKAEANRVVTTELDAYSARTHQAFRRLVQQIRASRYDVFVITFDSTRLRILAALSGAHSCAYCSLDGKVVLIRPTVAGTLAGAAARNLWGRLVYAWVWTVVRVAKVRGSKESSRGC